MSWVFDNIRSIGRRNLIGAAATVAVTSILLTGFLVENRYGYLPPDKLMIYVESWTEGRTREESLVRQRADHIVKERERAQFRREVAEANARADAMRGK